MKKSRSNNRGAKMYAFIVAVTTAVVNVPAQEFLGLRIPSNWPDLAGWDPAFPFPGELPSRFVWTEKFPNHPIRNQGACGSCWAFATVGALEFQILSYEREHVDLSEQWLLSCNRDGDTCDGGYARHSYFVRSSSKADDCGDNGAVLESDFPYRASNGTCSCPFPHRYWLEGWSYIGVVPGVFATDAQIKRAMYYFGPITASVNASNWKGLGSFTRVLSDCVSDKPNHLILIVGWSDDLGAWRIRNSWGSGWGQNGEAWVAYGCSSIGLGANYVRYPRGRGTWVDFDYTGTESGLFNQPFNTLSEGASVLSSGGTLSIKAGSTAAAPTWSKGMTIRAYGGSAVIGKR